MTNEELRELDAQVAQIVFGWTKRPSWDGTDWNGPWDGEHWLGPDGKKTKVEPPYFSSSWAGVGRLIDELHERGVYLDYCTLPNGRWAVINRYDDNDMGTSHESFFVAVCQHAVYVVKRLIAERKYTYD